LHFALRCWDLPEMLRLSLVLLALLVAHLESCCERGQGEVGCPQLCAGLEGGSKELGVNPTDRAQAMERDELQQRSVLDGPNRAEPFQVLEVTESHAWTECELATIQA